MRVRYTRVRYEFLYVGDRAKCALCSHYYLQHCVGTVGGRGRQISLWGCGVRDGRLDLCGCKFMLMGEQMEEEYDQYLVAVRQE